MADAGDVNGTSFELISWDEVPKGRDGKHKEIVTRLLRDIGQLKAGSALKIPLEELPDSKENIRAALNRATRLLNIDIATSSDAHHFYIWKVKSEK